MKQNVLITGSSSGFGFLMAQTVARAGYKVYAGMREINGRNAQSKHQLEALNLDISVLELDVTNDSSVAAAVSSIEVDVLVNNAGYTARGPLEGFTVEQARRIFETNVFGPLRMNRAVLPGMRSKGRGLIVQISSTVAHLNYPFIGLYASTKAALESLTESQSFELKPLGIDVVILQPGTYPTGVSAKAVSPEDLERIASYKPLLERFQIAYSAAQTEASRNDPQQVADALLEIIQTQQGSRARRSIAASERETAPVAQINAVMEGVQNRIIETVLK
jgi:NAD(P)-dependent dehydrogenase (short-subunit alcohol dehydrogenase family)